MRTQLSLMVSFVSCLACVTQTTWPVTVLGDAGGDATSGDSAGGDATSGDSAGGDTGDALSPGDVAVGVALRFDAGLATGSATHDGKVFLPLGPHTLDDGVNGSGDTGCAIAGTAFDDLYCTQLWRVGDIRFTVDVPDGDYVVHLHNAETTLGIDAIGERLFSVNINGERRVTDWDLYAQAGQRQHAVLLSFPVTVTRDSGKIVIDLVKNVQNPKLCGIEILPPGVAPLAVEAPPRCNDETQNGDETGIDCGGACVPCSPVTEALHPIAIDQHFIVPEDCEDGDVVGRVTTLYTDPIFNHRQGAYAFSIVAGNTDDALTIDSATGVISVNAAAAVQYGSDFDLGIRVTADADNDTVVAHVKVLEQSHIVYFDAGHVGTSDGRRTAPYPNFKDSGLSSGQAGTAYLFRRGTITQNERIYLTNAEDAATIIVGAWGTGARPIFDGAGQNTTFLTLGSWYSEDDLASKKCHNVDVYDLDMRDYGEEGVGGRMIVVPRSGHSFNFYRLRASGGVSGNGAIYFMASHPVDVFYDSQIYAQDIESYNNNGRGVKIEAGGVLVENFKDTGSTNTPISACMTPHVTLRYVYAEGNGGTGPNFRQFDQNVEWAYFSGYYRAIFVTPTLGVSGYGPWPLNDNTLRHVIIDGTTGSSGITMESSAGCTNVPENLVIDRVMVRGAAASGINITAGAVNTTVSYSLFHDNDNGITINASTSGTRIHNVIVADNTTADIVNNHAGTGELVNTIYGNRSGAFATETTNHDLAAGAHFADRVTGDYRPAVDAPYVGAGTSLGYSRDLDDREVGVPPTIGCYEAGF